MDCAKYNRNNQKNKLSRTFSQFSQKLHHASVLHEAKLPVIVLVISVMQAFSAPPDCLSFWQPQSTDLSKLCLRGWHFQFNTRHFQFQETTIYRFSLSRLKAEAARRIRLKEFYGIYGPPILTGYTYIPFGKCQKQLF